jgi:HEAT repeat protein
MLKISTRSYVKAKTNNLAPMGAMKISRRSKILIVLGITPVAFLAWQWRDRPQKDTSHIDRYQKSTTAIKNISRASSEYKLAVRYDPAKDPRKSPAAADAYHERREQLMRFYYGDGQIDMPLATLAKETESRTKILTAIGVVARQETITAVPLLLKFLDHPDQSIQRSAAKALCKFGDRRGFDFILEKCQNAQTLENWGSVFAEVFKSFKPEGYNASLIKLMDKLNGPSTAASIRATGIADVLASLGDVRALDVLLPIYARHPPETADAVLVLYPINDPRVLHLANKLRESEQTPQVKLAAGIILAAHGDTTAQQEIIATASRLISLPQPRKNDGSYKADLKPGSIGDQNAFWDNDAVLALERGTESLPSELAVPVLEKIATEALNVRFSVIAIRSLAKIGDLRAREALWQIARILPEREREFSSTIHTTLAKALALFSDDTSTALSKQYFQADKQVLEFSMLYAEYKGWNGLFNDDWFP